MNAEGVNELARDFREMVAANAFGVGELICGTSSGS